MSKSSSTLTPTQKTQLSIATIGGVAIVIAACIAVLPTLIPYWKPPSLQSQTVLPTACRTGVLCEVFPDIDEGEIFTWADVENNLTVDFTSTCALSGSYGLQIKYGFLGEKDDGGWGVHWAKTSKGYLDARNYSELVFWVRGETGKEKFQIGMKDIDKTEIFLQLNIFVVNISDWAMVIIPLEKFKPVKMEAVDNISFGFNNLYSSGNVCIDNIAFR